MAIYDFGAFGEHRRVEIAVFALSSSLSSAKTAAGNIDLMTVNGQNENNDQDTGFTAIFRPDQHRDQRAWDRERRARRKKFLFFVSDGVAERIQIQAVA